VSASVDDDVFEHSTMGPTEAMLEAFEAEAVRTSNACSACGEAGYCSCDEDRAFARALSYEAQAQDERVAYFMAGGLRS
jgi:hypothetical protein